MPIKFRCPHCQQKIKISSRYVGQSVDCPNCAEATNVPSEETIHRSHAPLHPERYVKSSSGDEPAFQLRSRPSSNDDDMDLTPMVDVTFQLLIFFILTASLSVQKAIEVPTPDPEKEGAAATMVTRDELEESSVIVEIQADNTIYVDDAKLSGRGQLVSALQESMRSTARAEMVINAHRSAFHETVVAVFDAANEVGMQRIRMVTIKNEDN